MQAILSRLVGLSEKKLVQAKQKIKEEGEKKVKQLKNKIPTQQQLFDKFTENICDANTIKKAEKNYKRFKKIIEGISKALESAKKGLEAIQKLVQKVLDILAKIIALIGTISVIISILNFVVNTAKIMINGVGMIPGTFSFPAGPLIMVQKAADAAEGVIKVLKAAMKSFTKALERPTEIAMKLMAIISGAILAVTSIINLLSMILQMLELLFFTLLNKCAVSNPGGDNNQTTNLVNGKTPEEYLAGMGYPGYAIDNIPLENKNPYDYADPLATYYEEIIKNLTLSGANEIIEKIYNAKFQMVGYRRYGIMGQPNASFVEETETKIDDRRYDD